MADLGRPKANIEWKKVEELLMAGCSGAEIAANFGISPHTIYDRCLTDNNIPFSDYSQQFYAKGESLLRAVQYSKAVKGDTAMLVWLGKNRLKQRDKEEDTRNSAHYTIKVNNDGIATGISTEILSATVHKGSE